METVLITGGTGKLGRVLVEQLLANNYRVIATSTSIKKFEAFIDTVDAGSNCIGIECDLLVQNAVSNLLDELDKRSIVVNHLINNARNLDSLAIDSDGLTSRKHFLAELELDVIVPYELSTALSRNMGDQFKSVINIGSQYGIVAPNPNLYDGSLAKSPIQYGVAKAALVHLTKELAVRLADRKIRVNCVAYGGVDGRVDEAFKARYAKMLPLGRMLSETDIPGPVLFLLNNTNAAITGHVLVVDGGWTIW